MSNISTWTERPLASEPIEDDEPAPKAVSSFKSFLMAGFECSSHRRFDGERVDMVAATRHDLFASADYGRLTELGIRTSREGLRWHLIETSPGKYDFASVSAQLDAAEKAGAQVIWDLFHYGYPDGLDIFAPDFPDHFANFAAAFAQFHVARTGRAPWVVPVNEISFFSWIAGEEGRFYPYGSDRADELKMQLVRTALAAREAIHDVSSRARFLSSEPAVYVKARPEEPWNAETAENYRLAQYQSFDMLTGRLTPELGGRAEYLDVIGVNYYPHNQWYYPDREMIPLGADDYRPFHLILAEIYGRYRKPIIVSETGTEGTERVPWYRYVRAECEAAIAMGVDLQGICLYPVLDHPGWEDERHCPNGLWGYPDAEGNRRVYEPLLTEIQSTVVPARQATVSTSPLDRVVGRP